MVQRTDLQRLGCQTSKTLASAHWGPRRRPNRCGPRFLPTLWGRRSPPPNRLSPRQSLRACGCRSVS